jgi:hypothetical protein
LTSALDFRFKSSWLAHLLLRAKHLFSEAELFEMSRGRGGWER